MSSSSTNKQPLLVDRPLLAIVSLTGTTNTPGTTEPAAGTTGALLVDCTNNDGGILDDIWLIQRRDSDTTPVNLFLSTSAQSLGVTAAGGAAAAFFLGRVVFGSGARVGAKISWEPPKILAPVPHAGGNVGYIVNGPTEVPQFRGLIMPRGLALWAAVDSATAVATAPNIACQGGLY